MYFPLRKNNIKLSNSETKSLASYRESTEIPLLPHPGAFGKIRKNHQHEGIDLYCEDGDEVISIEDGIVIDIFPFTGAQVNTPWWNDTWGLLIKSESGVLNYGEIIPSSHLEKNMKVKAGEIIGHVKTVLKKDKGRPMTMLHLEMYKGDTQKACTSWDLNERQPHNLLNPTQFLLNIVLKNKQLCSQQVWDNR